MKKYSKPNIMITPLYSTTVIQVSSLVNGGQQTSFQKVGTKSNFLNS